MSDPHRDGPLRRARAGAARASHALVLLHGRGGSADDMLDLADALALPDLALFAPEAAGRSWWPASFLAPMAALEPWLASALASVERAVAAVLDEGVAPERVHLFGFSQGACLALEAVARRGGPLGGVVALSGGLVGTVDADAAASDALYGYAPKRFDYAARLEGVDAYLSCHERDPHIPLVRVRESEAVFTGLGARVETRVKPGAGHGIDEADVAAIRRRFNAAPDPAKV